MDEQRLQEIENSYAKVPCQRCGYIVDGVTNQVNALVAEVRRLWQGRFHWTRHIADIADQRDAALAERDALREELVIARANHIDANTRNMQALDKRDAAEAALTEARRVLREVRPMLCDILKLTADVGAGNSYEAVARVIDQVDDYQRQSALGMGEGR